MAIELQGNGNNVSDSEELEKGLYIVTYKFVASDDFPIFIIQVENVEDEDDIEMVSESSSDSKKGRKFTGRQKMRLQGGRYVVSVNVNGATDWSVKLTKA